MQRLRKTHLRGQTRVGAHILGQTIGNALAYQISQGSNSAAQGQQAPGAGASTTDLNTSTVNLGPLHLPPSATDLLLQDPFPEATEALKDYALGLAPGTTQAAYASTGNALAASYNAQSPASISKPEIVPDSVVQTNGSSPGTSDFAGYASSPVYYYDAHNNAIAYNTTDGTITTNSDGSKSISSAEVIDATKTAYLRQQQAQVDVAAGIGLGVMFAPVAGMAAFDALGIGVVGGTSEGEGSAAINAARLDQINGGYNADEWAMTRLNAGSKVYGGVPGQSAYYTDTATLEASQGSRAALFQDLQVAPHPEFGYRPAVGEYEVLSDTSVPSGRVAANPAYGTGGGTQFFIDNYANSLRFIRSIPLGH